MLMPRTITILVCSLFAVQILHAGDEGTQLIYKLPESQSFRYDASSSLSQRFTMMEKSMTSLVTTDLELKVNVVESIMNRSTVDIMYDHGRITTKLKGLEEAPMQDTSIELETVRDLKLRMTIAPDGKVLNSTILAAHDESKQIMIMLRSTRLFDRLFVEFPNRAVSFGDMWKTTITDTTLAPQGLGSVITEGVLNLTYRGTRDTLGRKCWVIEFGSQGLHQSGDFSRGDIQMSLDGDGSFTGLSFHDVETGALVTSYSELSTVVTMNFTGQQSASVPVETRMILNVHQPRKSGK